MCCQIPPHPSDTFRPPLACPMKASASVPFPPTVIVGKFPVIAELKFCSATSWSRVIQGIGVGFGEGEAVGTGVGVGVDGTGDGVGGVGVGLGVGAGV